MTLPNKKRRDRLPFEPSPEGCKPCQTRSEKEHGGGFGNGGLSYFCRLICPFSTGIRRHKTGYVPETICNPRIIILN